MPLHRRVRPLGRPATWDDLLDVPETFIGEIIAGELVLSPRPGPPHVQAASDLGGVLFGPFRMGQGGPGGWIIFDEPRVRFGQDTRVPDLGGWRKERWPGTPRSGPFKVAPDWICEVLCPSTEREDRTTKFHLYAREGVKHLWLLNPYSRTLEAYRNDDGGWRVVGTWAEDAKVRAEPFDAIEFDLGLLWSGVERVDDEREDDGEASG